MGFEIDIFSTEPSASCICAVCHDVLKEASSLNCGHTFCDGCVKSLRNRRINTGGIARIRKSCPNCRATITSSNPNYVVREIIDALQVRCPNSTECDWTGRVDGIDQHDSTCLYKIIECDVVGCQHNAKGHLSDTNVKLQHMELKYDKKLEDMERKYEEKLEETEARFRSSALQSAKRGGCIEITGRGGSPVYAQGMIHKAVCDGFLYVGTAFNFDLDLSSTNAKCPISGALDAEVRVNGIKVARVGDTDNDIDYMSGTGDTYQDLIYTHPLSGTDIHWKSFEINLSFGPIPPLSEDSEEWPLPDDVSDEDIEEVVFKSLSIRLPTKGNQDDILLERKEAAEREKKQDRKLKQMEKKFTQYENRMQEYENRLQAMGRETSAARGSGGGQQIDLPEDVFEIPESVLKSVQKRARQC